MTQATIDTIDPATTSGVELAQLLVNFADALRTSHLGTSRPTYAERGTFWIKQVSASILEYYVYDGGQDILLGTINTASNLYTPAGLPSITLAGLGGVPTTRSVNTGNSLQGGGNLSADRSLSLVNDAASPGTNRYYGTNSGGTKGFFPLPSLVSTFASDRVAAYSAGSHTFTVPSNVTRIAFWALGAVGGSAFYYADRVAYPGARAGAMGSISVVPSSTVSITVGLGGGGLIGVLPGQSAPNGGTTSIGTAVTLTGSGGGIVLGDGNAQTGAAGVTTPGGGQNVTLQAPMLHGWETNSNGLVLIWYP